MLREKLRRLDRGGLGELYPETGDLRRELYPKHIKMFAQGATCDQRVALGGNRTGKSFGIGGYETALHLTGLYPDWWEGKRFVGPILAWACGTKSLKVRDVNQQILLGRLKQVKTTTVSDGGLVPARMIKRVVRKSGVTDAADRVIIQHTDGHENVLSFKSYEEGRKAFEAEACDWIWLDEEPPPDVYDECLMRLLTRQGHMIVTLTPVEGFSATVMRLLDGTDYL